MALPTDQQQPKAPPKPLRRPADGALWALRLGGLALAVLAYLLLFNRLGSAYLNTWDEALYAVNLLEMRLLDSWWIPYYNGQPELWSTKPPLFAWLQNLSWELLGGGRLALRLPSALSALATVAVVALAARRWTGAWAWGLLAGGYLLAMRFFVFWHGARTGDHDALLTFFLTLQVWAGVEALRSGRFRPGWWLLACVATSLAVLTKSAAGLLLAPFLALGLLVTPFFRSALLRWATLPWLVGGLLLAALPVGGYYLWREQLQPGYLAQIWLTEWGGRFLQPTGDADASDPLLYLKLLGWGVWWGYRNSWVGYWPLGVCLGFGVAFVVRVLRRGRALGPLQQADNWRLVGVLLVAGAGFLWVLSSAANHKTWYQMPVYPLLALLSALAAQELWRQQRLGGWARLGVFCAFLVLAAGLGQGWWNGFRFTQQVSKPWEAGTVGVHLSRQLQDISPQAPQFPQAMYSPYWQSPIRYRLLKTLGPQAPKGYFVPELIPAHTPVLVCGGLPRAEALTQPPDTLHHFAGPCSTCHVLRLHRPALPEPQGLSLWRRMQMHTAGKLPTQTP